MVYTAHKACLEWMESLEKRLVKSEEDLQKMRDYLGVRQMAYGILVKKKFCEFCKKEISPYEIIDKEVKENA